MYLEWSFQFDEILEKHEKFCQNHGHCAANISEKLKSVFDEDRNNCEQVPKNTKKNMSQELNHFINHSGSLQF